MAGLVATASQQMHLGVRHRIAAFVYAAIAVVSLAIGWVYWSRDTFMPYHAVALGKDWGELSPATQALLKALMEVAAGGWLAVGALVLTLVAIPIRRGERWARLAAPAALSLFYVPTLLATLKVLRETPASPPWLLGVAACSSVVIALLLDTPWRSVRRADEE